MAQPWILAGLVAVAAAAPALADTLYRCKTYDGGIFHSATPCAGRKAFVDSVHTVPDGLSFPEQVDLVEKAAKARAAAATREAREGARRNRCALIRDELERLAEKYARAQHVPADEVNADQRRERELKSESSRERCARP